MIRLNHHQQDQADFSSMTTLWCQLILHFRDSIPLFGELRERRRLALRELLALSGTLQMECEKRLLPVRTREVSDVDLRDAKIAWESSPMPDVMGDCFVMLEVEVPFDMEFLSKNLESQGQSANSDELFSLARSLVSSDLGKFAGDLLLAGVLANPGALEPIAAWHVIDGRFQEAQEYGPSTFYDACENAAKWGWPPLTVLGLADCVAWLRRIPGFEDGVPSGAAGRAVSAISHVMTEHEASSPGAALMWFMVGLETLYTRGKEGLSQQLYEKGQVLLGPIKVHKKTFRGLYAYRSSFIHGGLDIPLSYTPYDGLPDFERLQHDAYVAQLVACAFLIATLQAMVQAGVHELEFESVLKPRASPKE